MNKNALYSTIIQTVPIKRKEFIQMNDTMVKYIEKWAIECYEDPKIKMRDEIVF